MRNSAFLQQLVRHWDHAQQAFRVGLDLWYRPTKEIYFITWISKMGKDWTQFLKMPTYITTKTQLIYVHRYVRPNIVQPTYFQVVGGQLWIDSFYREEVRCMSLIIMRLAHYTSDGHQISFRLMYYVDSLVMRT